MKQDQTMIGRAVRYDRERRRVWLAGRRVHHGATGIILALVGGALIVHDWKDRSAWLNGRDGFG